MAICEVLVNLKNKPKSRYNMIFFCVKQIGRGKKHIYKLVVDMIISLYGRTETVLKDTWDFINVIRDMKQVKKKRRPHK